jgi:hemolysin activation/secretion protein
VVCFHKTTITVLAALIVSAQIPMPAAAETIPGSADVTRLQNDLQNKNNPPPALESPAPLASPQQSPPSEAVPGNADAITFTLQGIALQGVSVYKPGELESIWQKDIGKTVSLKRVYDIAAAITARYRADGYFLASAYIPAQEIGNGGVRIAVVEGYIGQVQLGGDIPASSHILGLLKNRLLSLGPLNIRMLERQMLLLNDLPGTHFRAVLKPLDDGVADSAPLQTATPAPPTSNNHVSDNVPSPAPQGPPATRDPMSVAVAARISANGPVVFISPLDDIGRTLAARIRAAGGDLQNIQLIGPVPPPAPVMKNPGNPSPPPRADQDNAAGSPAGRLETTLEQIGNVDLVVVDPVGSSATKEQPSAEDIRRALAPLAQAATRHHVPVLAAQCLGADHGISANPAIAPTEAVAQPVKEGGVLLEIVGVAENPVHGSVSLDNSGSRYLGPLMATAQMSIDRFLPAFQQAVITLNSSVPDHELKSVLGKYIIPLTDNGIKLSFNAGYSQGRPGYTLTPDELVADSITLGTELAWDALRQRTENLRVVFGLDYLDSRTSLLDLPFVDDRITAARLGIHYDEQDRLEGSVIVDATLKRGLPIFGASHADDENLSRADGKPDFTSLTSTVYRFQTISAGWNALLGISGEVASAPLLSSQQFGYGGQSFGRAYDSSELVGDQGIAAIAELRYDGLRLPDGFHFQPFAFYDIGRVWNLAAGLPARTSGASGGFGFRLAMPRGFTLSLTVADPLTRPQSDPQYGDGKDPRVIFSLSDAF